MTGLLGPAGLVVVLCGIAYLYRIAHFCLDGCERGNESVPVLIAPPAVDPACRKLDLQASEHCCQVIVLKRQSKPPLFSAFGDEFGARRRLLTKEQELVAQKREYNAELLAAAQREEVEHFNQCNRLGMLANACPNRNAITVESLDCLTSAVLANFSFPNGSDVEKMRQLLLGGSDALGASSSPFTLSRYSDRHHDSVAQAGQCFYATDQVWAKRFIGGATTRIVQSNTTIRCFPSLVIIGVQKGSTTELRRALLRGNRGLVKAVAPHKLEPHILETSGNNTKQIEKTYLTQSAVSPSEFFRLQVLLDKTPSYFHDSRARLDYFNNIQMVLLLRDPAVRMYSGYWNLCLIKYQSARNCSNAKLEHIVLADKRTITNHDVLHAIEVGHYATHLVRIAELFKSTRKTGKLFISFAEDFQRDGAGYFVRLSTFLGLPHALRYLNDSTTTAIPTTPKALKFNSLRATGYAKPDPEMLNHVRRKIYGESLNELRALLLSPKSMLFANPNFTVVVDQVSNLLPDWLMHNY
ncbi:hypothetical protein BASA81_009836 [Batrachochytrium salamandrivorans]|nr:hypothetical protein BASA81_009836 [Batrachochytrium salamandrivorans]